MERFDFFMERFPVCHGADVRLTVQFLGLTVEFPDLTGLTKIYRIGFEDGEGLRLA